MHSPVRHKERPRCLRSRVPVAWSAHHNTWPAPDLAVSPGQGHGPNVRRGGRSAFGRAILANRLK